MAAPTQIVQVLKQESTAGGGDSADADPYQAWELIRENQDAFSGAGLFLQKVQPVLVRDTDVLIWRDEDTLRAKDGVYGEFDLLSFAAKIDFLLENDPPDPDTTYAVSRSGGLVGSVEWTRNPGNRIKRVDITRSAGLVSEIVTRVYAEDGTTVVGQTTETFTRSGGLLSSGAKVRDV